MSSDTRSAAPTAQPPTARVRHKDSVEPASTSLCARIRPLLSSDPDFLPEEALCEIIEHLDVCVDCRVYCETLPGPREADLADDARQDSSDSETVDAFLGDVVNEVLRLQSDPAALLRAIRQDVLEGGIDNILSRASSEVRPRLRGRRPRTSSLPLN